METAVNFAVCVVHAILFCVDNTCQLYMTNMLEGQALLYAVLVVCWVPLVFNMMFMIFMVNKYVPTVNEKDEVFGKGQHLEKLSDVKYYDILHHSEIQLRQPFRFLYASFKRERIYTRVFHIGYKAVVVLVLYGSSSNPTRNLFLCHCAYCLVYLFFPGPYMLVKTNRSIYSAF